MANSWRHERWDSLRLLTPNWASGLPEFPYAGPDPDGYMTASQVVELLTLFSSRIIAPVRTGMNVSSLRREGDGYSLTTGQGDIRAEAVVIASGACNRASTPSFAEGRSPDRSAADTR